MHSGICRTGVAYLAIIAPMVEESAGTDLTHHTRVLSSPGAGPHASVNTMSNRRASASTRPCPSQEGMAYTCCAETCEVTISGRVPGASAAETFCGVRELSAP